MRSTDSPACQTTKLPTFHFYHKRLLDHDPPTVHDNTLGVRQVPVICVLKLNSVNYSLKKEREERNANLVQQSGDINDRICVTNPSHHFHIMF